MNQPAPSSSPPHRRPITAFVVLGILLLGALAGCSSGTPDESQALALTGVTAIDAGASTTCAVASGAAYCWGANEHGQLGIGSTENQHRPVRVEGLTDVTAIAAGDTSCAVSDGDVYCWGSNTDGQLGNHLAPMSAVPSRVEGISGATAVATDQGSRVCAIASGELYCWGLIGYGTPGDGGRADDGEAQTTPRRIEGLEDVTAVALDTDFSCAIAAGELYCWGSNSEGQLGDGTTVDHLTPQRVEGLTDVTAVTTGGPPSACAIAAGELFCWGSQMFGLLGDGADSDGYSSTPARVAGLGDVSAIGTGWAMRCAVSGGDLYCWGSNHDGLLGDGTEGDRFTPATGNGLTEVTAFSGGVDSSCALSGGTAYCWGANESGQLGDGTTDSRRSPVSVRPAD